MLKWVFFFFLCGWLDLRLARKGQKERPCGEHGLFSF